jgi:peptide chain release factor 2
VQKQQLEVEMARPGFWENPEAAQRVIDQLKSLNAVLDSYEELQKAVGDLRAMVELAEEDPTDQMQTELAAALPRVESLVRAFGLRHFLSGPNDPKNAFVTIHAGAGGTDACDWVQMLLRMYSRWAERHGFQVEAVDELPDEEAGFRSVTLAIRGDYAYGYLKGESGVHRLVRISPFDAAARRHTSFASVDVMPERDETPEIEIREEDLLIETMRSSGAGGQHVNKTSSAVRITHLPTGIVVKCQNERSQHRNRALAMKLLRAKLLRLEEAKRHEELRSLYDEKGDISFGYQIRSYILQPYQLVKDHRTGVETSKVQDVLDGEIDIFLEAYLRHSSTKQLQATTPGAKHPARSRSPS